MFQRQPQYQRMPQQQVYYAAQPARSVPQGYVYQPHQQAVRQAYRPAFQQNRGGARPQFRRKPTSHTKSKAASGAKRGRKTTPQQRRPKKPRTNNKQPSKGSFNVQSSKIFLLSAADDSGKRTVVLGQNMTSSYERVRVGRSAFHLELVVGTNNQDKVPEKGQKRKRTVNIVIPQDSLESISMIGRFGTDADAKIEGLTQSIRTLSAERHANNTEKKSNGATPKEVSAADAARVAAAKAEEAAGPPPEAAGASMTLLEAYRLKVVGCFFAPGSSPEDLALKPAAMTCKLLGAALKKRKLGGKGKKADLQARLKRYLADALEEADIDEGFAAECKDVKIVAANGDDAAAAEKPATPAAKSSAASAITSALAKADCCRLVIRLKTPVTLPSDDETKPAAGASASLIFVDLKPVRARSTFKGKSPRRNGKGGKTPRENLALAFAEGGSLAAYTSGDAPVDKADAALFAELLGAYLEQRAAVHELVECEQGCGAKLHRFQVDAHLAAKCSNRSAKCGLCAAEMKHAGLQKHRVEACPKRLVPCPKRCGAKKVAHDALAEHALTCAQESVQCPYALQGCKTECTRSTLKKHCSGSVEHHLQLVSTTLAKLQQAVVKSGIVLSKDD